MRKGSQYLSQSMSGAMSESESESGSESELGSGSESGSESESNTYNDETNQLPTDRLNPPKASTLHTYLYMRYSYRSHEIIPIN